jgi:hypothetical protein
VTNAVGETWDDPSEDLLFMMLEELNEKNSSLVVERLDVSTAGESLMRVARLKRGPFDIEHQEQPCAKQSSTCSLASHHCQQITQTSGETT